MPMPTAKKYTIVRHSRSESLHVFEARVSQATLLCKLSSTHSLCGELEQDGAKAYSMADTCLTAEQARARCAELEEPVCAACVEKLSD